MMSIFKFLENIPGSDDILYQNILYDDREKLINQSIRNFILFKQQNKESLNNYIKVFIEQLDELENNIIKEVQKMIDLSYIDYTQFRLDSRKKIIAFANEFNKYIKNKYNRSHISMHTIKKSII